MNSQFPALKFEDNFEIVPQTGWVKERIVANDNDAKILRYLYDIDIELQNTNRITRFSMLYELWRESLTVLGRGAYLRIPRFTDKESLAILEKCGLSNSAHVINVENQNPEYYFPLKFSPISSETRGRNFDFTNKFLIDHPFHLHRRGLMEDYLTVKSLVISKLQTVHTLVRDEFAKESFVLRKQKYTRLLLPYSTNGTYPPNRLIAAIRPEHGRNFCITQCFND